MAGRMTSRMVGIGTRRKGTAHGMIGKVMPTGARRLGMKMLEAEDAGKMTEMVEAEATGTAGKK